MPKQTRKQARRQQAISCLPALSIEKEVPRTVDFQDKNLVDVVASSSNKFVSACMSILFTEKELSKGYIIDGPTTSNHEPLDLTRFQLLLGSVFFYI